jgi:hypothetical protein
MGTITSLGHNLLASLDTNATVSLSSSDLLGTSNQPIDAMLGLLSDNGGPTMTVALQSGSPAIDAGDDLVLADPWNLTTDQRGLARKQGNHVDIGAYESPYTHVELTRLAAGFSAANEQFTVVLSGTIGKSYDLLSSTDLVHWSRVTTLTNTTGKVTWILPLADSAAAQYFRAQQLP